MVYGRGMLKFVLFYQIPVILASQVEYINFNNRLGGNTITIMIVKHPQKIINNPLFQLEIYKQLNNDGNHDDDFHTISVMGIV